MSKRTWERAFTSIWDDEPVVSYKWELRHGKDGIVLSNDIRDLQRLQGELGGFIYRRGL